MAKKKTHGAAAAQPRAQRRTRANGEQSRERILDAATEVATERGYDGTTISLVSKKSGLPPTSIYWHFADKDDLIAAVIDRSFQRWLAALDLPAVTADPAWVTELGGQVAKALLDAPDFLRLGLMLSLERRPAEPRAREMFLEVRDRAFHRFEDMVREVAPALDDEGVRLLTTYAIAGADGLFIAKEVGGDSVDLVKLMDLHARIVFEMAAKLLGPEGPA
ncbi:TetR family transcriptional regulator [Mycobacterium bohemicum DSM 44277]|uniref:TetR family transcriptional regulator n=2 Tax=Mycobacterium bohemicum TaxID=56425 RepID=A0A1X1QYC5_MYCBE|nr:TetR/AcrR family transcriptional regulator [Mycobacterium bohemicum]MCV6968971.1 TetR/AcrR family transcriptional regulator [Mycobacterium bohemicum]ORU96407.1 TetR family transcriptional regulator [Mycobacterium bohemicum]CPR11265.1 TetR family transcriptional regulator [Mycobacterium bohemicum DSM 44277]